MGGQQMKRILPLFETVTQIPSQNPHPHADSNRGLNTSPGVSFRIKSYPLVAIFILSCSISGSKYFLTVSTKLLYVENMIYPSYSSITRLFISISDSAITKAPSESSQKSLTVSKFFS